MKTLLTLTMCMTLLLACSDTSKQNTSSAEEVSESQSLETSAMEAYMQLKDALVQTDASAAKKAAMKLSAAFSSEEMEPLLIKAAEVIASSEDVELQRTSFKTVTDGLIMAFKANEKEDGLFVQYCPMAFDNTGASWISLSDQIRNPYFGDRMLKCGTVLEKL